VISCTGDSLFVNIYRGVCVCVCVCIYIYIYIYGITHSVADSVQQEKSQQVITAGVT
jgi:protein-S-isoprenylcysteine O-methyltransferase Ste14